ncbi:MAG: hypothetical protein A2941_01740 [Candidatus Yanofskybacteria bacterium RIFCSPLOWO2_01_FULL_49_17]|uniref:Uncharacterized protein n=1 Tax=Candidatus Yanofskybacteria bacterium RIFCSPLOWO2_01_FULL_49_17 TaxID=1802700 RepID=A0A1F8GTB8_9BACT|nr:MAG: hypothetical protein A2941_01740 [Candidatus Yanofskybacteria bacterium RIFCSPLOWO2_01_FULL_49_17]
MPTTEEKDRRAAKKLFGSINLPKYVGGLAPTPEQLAKLAVTPEEKFGKVHVYCAGCGFIDCFNQAGGEELSRGVGIPTPTDWKQKYFQVDRCEWCSPENPGYINPVLKEVKPQ